MTKIMPKSRQSRRFPPVPTSRSWHLSAIVALIGLLPWTVFGLGSRIPNQDPEAIGRGNAFAATADNPSAIYYNPAGITQLQGNNLQIGSLFYLNIYADYQSPSGQKIENKHKITPVPEIHYVFTPKDQPFSFGF